MNRSRTSRAAAGLGLAAALTLALTPQASADDSGTEAASPLQGQSVEAGTNQDNAPVLEPGNYYTDSFGSETSYYRVARTMDASTLHVGLTTFDGEGLATDDIEVALGTFDGSPCDSSRLGWEVGQAGNLLRSAQLLATSPADPEHHSAVPECGSNQEILLTVETLGDDLAGEDFELVIAEEPDPVNGDQLGSSLEDTSEYWGAEGLTWHQLDRDRGADNPVDPGSSPHQAPVLESGSTYDAVLEPGEIHIYRIAADWNEQIQAEVFFPEPTSQLAEHLANWSEAEVSIISPYRGSVTAGNSHASEEQTTSGRINDALATTLRAQSYPVNWASRFADNQMGTDSRHAAFPGDYYVVVSMEPPGEDQDSFEVPYRLTAGVFDAIDETIPEYEQDPVLPANGEGTSGNGGSGSGQGAGERTSGISPGQGLAIGLGLLGVLLIVGGGVFLAQIMRQQRTD